MKKRVSLLMLGGVIAALTLVVGCTEEEEEPEATETVAATATEAPTEAATATEAPTEAATTAPTEAPTETAVPEGPPVPAEISGFTLPEVTAAVDSTVIWTNADDAPHTVTAQDGSFGGSLSAGGEYRHTFTAAGTFDYICTIHEGMQATVTIQ